jgi:amino acid permease
MARSTGIAVSAILEIIGSAFTVLFGVMMLLMSVLALNSNRAADAPVNVHYVLIVESFFFFAFGGWGLPPASAYSKRKSGENFDVGIRGDSAAPFASRSDIHGPHSFSQYSGRR